MAETTAAEETVAEETVAEVPVVTTEQEARFRTRVRRFLERQTTTSAAGGTERDPGDVVSRARRFQGALFDEGLAALTWTPTDGGGGLPARYQTIYDEEAAAFALPTEPLTVTLDMCLPTVLAYGTPEQKDRFVRPALSGTEIWCELFSEPGGTSDLALVRTEAVLDGDRWVVDGQKAWASGAQHSEYGLLLARTDPEAPRHQDLTMFIVDMHSDGLTIRPKRQMNGAAGSNDVFFDHVHIPADHVLGQLHRGWPVVLTTLEHERASIGAARRQRRASPTPSPLDAIAAHTTAASGSGSTGDRLVRQGLADLYLRSQVTSLLAQRIRAETPAGEAGGPRSSLTKLARTQVTWEAAELGAALVGSAATAWNDPDEPGARWAQLVVSAPASGIAGGTSEVMRTIVGERILGLPKEPRP